MFSYLWAVGTSNGSTKLQHHCAMCLRKLLIGLFCLPPFARVGPTLTPAETEARDHSSDKLRALIEASPKLPLQQRDLLIKLSKEQDQGMVSWLARDPKTGVTWLIQRGDKADRVIAVDKEGRVLGSFGKGLYKIPHAIRLDPEGNVWTVDAGSSTVIKFSAKGKKLLEIDVGGQPEPAISPFRGTTDIVSRVGQCRRGSGPGRASTSSLISSASTRTASLAPKISVDVVGENVRLGSPAMAFGRKGAVGIEE
jgi:hypothetical protein